MNPQPDKMTEAVIYLCQISAEDPYLDKDKLIALLYHADGAAYAQHGQTITGATYRHFPNGPLPDGWHLLRKGLEQHGDAAILYDHTEPGYTSYRIVLNRPANLEYLSPDDCRHLSAQVQRFAEQNSAGIAQYAREEAAWLCTDDGEPMRWELHGIAARGFNIEQLHALRAGLDDLHQP